MGGSTHPPQIIFALFIQPIGIVFQKGMAKAINTPQRSTQVMGDRVGKGFQLLVHRSQFGVYTGQRLCLLCQHFLCPLALGDVPEKDN